MSLSRQSKKRDAVYAALQSVKSHPTAEWLHEHLKGDIPDLSLGTVYRNLALFKKEGLAVSVATVNGRERFDACTRPHVHFICRSCEAVIDLENVPMPQPPPLDMVVETSQLNFFGICSKCAATRRKNTGRSRKR